MNQRSRMKVRWKDYCCFNVQNYQRISNNIKTTKYSRIGRSVSLMARKSKTKTNRRTQSCKAKKGNASMCIAEVSSQDIKLRSKSTEKVDIGTQTRFSLNSQLIKDIDEMIKEQEESDSDQNSAELVIEDPQSDEWSDSEIRGIGSSWSVCSDPTHSEISERDLGSRRTSDPNQDPLGELHVQASSVRRPPVRYASRSASMVESTLDPPLEENEEEPESDSENLDISCPVDSVSCDPGYQYRLQNQEDVCQEPDTNIQSVLSSLQSRRGAVHTAVVIADPKDKFKMPFFSKRKNDRKWSKTELNSVLSESSNDRVHPLSDLMMSHWSELMEDRPHLDSVEYKHRDALWGLFRAELVYLIEQLKIIRDVFQGTLKMAKDNGMLSDVDENLLFPNVNKLYKVSNAFSLDLYKMFKEGNASDESVVQALQEFSKKFHHPYQRYCLNYTRAAKYLKTLKKERSDFREYEKLCMEDSRCKKRQLSDLLICPMQHLMRYVILLQDIQKHVPEHGRDDLRETIETIQESLRSLESKLATLQNFQRLQELDNILIWPKIDSVDKSIVIPEELKETISEDQSTLCSDGRHILHAGALVLLENPKSTETYCFLFNDMLLITRTNSTIRKRYNNKLEQLVSPGFPSSGDVFDTSGGLYDPDQRYIVYKQPIALDETRVHDISSSPGGCKNCFSVTTYNRLKCCTGLYTFNAVSAENKRQWIEKLLRTSEEFRMSNPATPINRRPRLDSMHINNGDSISLNSGNSSFNDQCSETPTVRGGSTKKPAHTQSFTKSNSILHKIPKRCRSAS
ncbi:hypothetical protein ACHWQZ_G009179 [Mnemiopsis leidyi]